jgi:hypothetical protein
LNRWLDTRRNQQYFVSKKAQCFEQAINLHIKVITKPYETDYKCHAALVYVVVQNWNLKKVAKGAKAEDQENFENC